MEPKADTNNIFKKALKQRVTHNLPSNFNHVMMGRIEAEAEKLRKKQRIINWLWLISSSVLLFVLGLYALISYAEVSLTEYFNSIEELRIPSDLISFYLYIAVLIFVLLGFDFWMRRYKRKAMNK